MEDTHPDLTLRVPYLTGGYGGTGLMGSLSTSPLDSRSDEGPGERGCIVL